MSWSHTSFESIRHSLDRIAEENGWDRYHTPRNLLLAVQKEVGDVADVLQYRPDAPVGLPGWSPSERKHLEDELADVVAYTIRLADKCSIDLGRAVTEKLAKSSAAVSRPQPTASPPISQASPGNPLAQASPKTFDVKQASSPHRPAGTQRGQTRQKPHSTDSKDRPEKSGSTGTIASKRNLFKRTLSVVCERMQDAEALYSPSHFQHDLFSPVTNQKDFDVEYNTKQPPLPVSLSKQSLKDHAASNSQPPAPAPAPAERSELPLSPRSLDGYSSMIDELATAVDAMPDDEWEDMDLRYCTTIDGQIVPLIVDGLQIKVERKNVQDFVRLHKERNELGDAFEPPLHPSGTSRSLPVKPSALRPKAVNGVSAAEEAAAKRRGMKRTLSIQLPSKQYDAQQVSQCFSPTHFDHDLFSPNTTQQDFEVEYSCSPEKKSPVVPDAGKEKKQNGENRRTSMASLGSDEEEEYKGLDLLCEVAQENNEDEEAAREREGDLERNFLGVLDDIEEMIRNKTLEESDLVDMHLTFCVPGGGKIYDLIPDGRSVRVTMDRILEFISLARRKRQEIERGC
ncbi:nucleoside triphosphate pyrophosphohydrolase [Diplonema papillatum]|nr:nucleoside triphosphate pyrophosphohydrolase [Diplonema papillatum]